MSQQEGVRNIFEKQRQYFNQDRTRCKKQRKDALRRLFNSVKKYEGKILDALAMDLGKSEGEAFLTEVMVVRNEIKFTLKHLSCWMRPKWAPTPLTILGSGSRIMAEPLGTVLIIAPWNYPFQLSLMPLIPAIAAGNTAIVKPSELAPATSSVIREIIENAFSSEEVAVVEGGIPETQALLELPFDHIFFTGGEAVGKIVMQAAAKHLAPVTLELGGKSPVILAKDANLTIAARRIAWGKFTNAGQTCVAPDYLLLEREMQVPFLRAIQRELEGFYGKTPATSSQYGRIVSDRHFDRLVKFLEGEKIVIGGNHNKEDRFIAPTILADVSPDSPIMQEEIFGPILPLVPVDTMEEAMEFVRARPKPLALYVFSEDKKLCNRVLARCSSGGACVNDTLVHLSSSYLPFGGVGTSGMGAYHGKKGFESLSHIKSVVRTNTLFDLPLRYPPYPAWLKSVLKWL